MATYDSFIYHRGKSFREHMEINVKMNFGLKKR